MYTTGQIFECLFFVFFIVINLFCALSLQLFDKKYSINVVVLSNSITILNIFFYFSIFPNVFYSCDAKLNFQCHRILQKSS